jgi:hypothetical protein
MASLALVDTCNNFAGVTPFDELKSVKKFTSRKTAVTRIWEALARISPDGAHRRPISSAWTSERSHRSDRSGRC